MLRDRLKELARVRRRFGYRRLHLLLRRKGWSVNRILRGPWPRRSRVSPDNAVSYLQRGRPYHTQMWWQKARLWAPEPRWRFR